MMNDRNPNTVKRIINRNDTRRCKFTEFYFSDKFKNNIFTF